MLRVLSAKRGGAAVRAELMRASGFAALAIFVSAVMAIALFDRSNGPLCASRTMRARVDAEWERWPTANVYDIAVEVGAPVAVVLDALPQGQRVGVPGNELPAVWRTLQDWPHALLYLVKGGQSFSVRAPLQAIRPGGKLDVLQIGGPTDALTGRLQPREIGAIYAFSAHSGGKISPAVLFLDRHGEVMFEVAPRDVFTRPLRTVPPEFAATFKVMSTLTPLCERLATRHFGG